MVTFFNLCRRRPAPLAHSEDPPSSVLLIQDLDPKRFQPIFEASRAMQNQVARIFNLACDAFSRFNSSLSEVFFISELMRRFRSLTITTLAQELSPYILAYSAFYLQESLRLSSPLKTDCMKMTLGFVMLGYLLTEKYTEIPRFCHPLSKIAHQAAAIFTLSLLHFTAYHSASRYAEIGLDPLVEERYISHETLDNLSILAGIVSTAFLLPKASISSAKLIDQMKRKIDKSLGLKTQAACATELGFGMTSEINGSMILYNHFTTQMNDPERLFQYFIVSLNVLKDVSIPDPRNPQAPPKKGLSLVLNKTRNLWLLAADSFIKASTDYALRAQEIEADIRANLHSYTCIRNGKQIQNVLRHQLEVGDLVSLDQAVQVFEDPSLHTSRIKAQLSGYLIQMGPSKKPKKVAISLVELNGENHPVILLPSLKIRSKKECKTIDLFSVPIDMAILPGTEFLSFDNDSHSPSSEGLYVQIADASQIKQVHQLKQPYSLQSAKDLKKKLIYASLFFSQIAALPLMNYRSQPMRFKKMFQYYGTEFVDKFTQVFSEAQTIIPLVSEVALEMVNHTLMKEINAKLEHKLSQNNALCIADLFEFLKQKKVKIFSDKTGTITETFMTLRSLYHEGTIESLDMMVRAFATSFSDQKTEAEENEIKRYFEAHHDIMIHAEADAGKVGSFIKTISQTGKDPIRFQSKKLGLFTDFGGQFSLRIEDGKDPVCVFCGIPRAPFSGTKLESSYKAYEAIEEASWEERKESLTRDWCIAEHVLSAEDYEALQKGLLISDPEESHHQLSIVLNSLLPHFSQIGVFRIDNPLKQGAKDAIVRWKTAGIDFMLITGDTKNASFKIAKKLYRTDDACLLDENALMLNDDVFETDLSLSTVVLTNTSKASLELLDKLNHLGPKKPSIIFAQMKDIDKKRLVDHMKSKDNFIIASGDGCNDILMLNSSHIAIANSAHDGTFARGLEEVATITDLQIKQLMAHKESTIYELFDIDQGKSSLFLNHFARLANTQPKVITSLMAKSLKSIAIPRLLGKFTRELPFQFGALLSYDALFLTATYQACLTTANTPLIIEPVNRSIVPLAVLVTSLAIAAIQSMYAYSFHEEQITTYPMLTVNLLLAASSLYVLLDPPGFRSHARL
jgi:hypothetical protein